MDTVDGVGGRPMHVSRGRSPGAAAHYHPYSPRRSSPTGAPARCAVLLTALRGSHPTVGVVLQPRQSGAHPPAVAVLVPAAAQRRPADVVLWRRARPSGRVPAADAHARPGRRRRRDHQRRRPVAAAVPAAAGQRRVASRALGTRAFTSPSTIHTIHTTNHGIMMAPPSHTQQPPSVFAFQPPPVTPAASSGAAHAPAAPQSSIGAGCRARG